jgi:hypothetical protein
MLLIDAATESVFRICVLSIRNSGAVAVLLGGGDD